jgi:cytochrome c oxidase assembly factor CtaG
MSLGKLGPTAVAAQPAGTIEDVATVPGEVRDEVADALSPSDRRRWPWFETVGALVTVGIVAVLATALVRAGTPGQPVLPLSWARTGAEDRMLPHLLGRGLFSEWSFDPIADVVLLVLAGLYGAGVLVARRVNGVSWSLTRTASFLAGLIVCFLATNSSIAVYDMTLFSAHMIGHLMLVMAAPVLLCGGEPLNLLLAATGPLWRGRLERLFHGRVFTVVFCPPVALATYAAVIVGSHLTGLMDTIMLRPWAGQLEHLVYVLVGFQFFTLVMGQPPIRWNLTTPARWGLLVLSMAVDTFTGVILIMALRPVSMVMNGSLMVQPLSDTRTGGAIMWVGGDGLMALVMIGLVISWLRRPEQRERDRGGWVEQARQSTFATHTGSSVPAEDVADRIDFDDQDANRERYNRWLASMDKK